MTRFITEPISAEESETPQVGWSRAGSPRDWRTASAPVGRSWSAQAVRPGHRCRPVGRSPGGPSGRHQCRGHRGGGDDRGSGHAGEPGRILRGLHGLPLADADGCGVRFGLRGVRRHHRPASSGRGRELVPDLELFANRRPKLELARSAEPVARARALPLHPADRRIPAPARLRHQRRDRKRRLVPPTLTCRGGGDGVVDLELDGDVGQRLVADPYRSHASVEAMIPTLAIADASLGGRSFRFDQPSWSGTSGPIDTTGGWCRVATEDSRHGRGRAGGTASHREWSCSPTAGSSRNAGYPAPRSPCRMVTWPAANSSPLLVARW